MATDDITHSEAMAMALDIRKLASEIARQRDEAQEILIQIKRTLNGAEPVEPDSWETRCKEAIGIITAYGKSITDAN